MSFENKLPVEKNESANRETSAECVDVAIIGAGTSGCLMANLLQEADINCVLIEKSRGLGGRCSRRRVTVSAPSSVAPNMLSNKSPNNEPQVSLDMGAASFSPESIKYKTLEDRIHTWQEAGILTSWRYQTCHFGFEAFEHLEEPAYELTAFPSMNTWHKHMATEVKQITSCRVSQINQISSVWYLYDEEGELIVMANKVIITSPAEQTLGLLTTSELFEKSPEFQRVKTASEMSLGQYVCAIETNTFFDHRVGVYQGGHGILAKATRLSYKSILHEAVNHAADKDIWMLESCPKWAKAQEQEGVSHEDAALELAQAFCLQFAIHDPVRILTSHYWRLARHRVGSDESHSYILDTESNLGICGDWLDSGDIAGALNSAQSLFNAMNQALINDDLSHQGDRV
ncbi:NAD(P)-binding protein [Marinomonas sp. PE14-40]|uniref:NAD(P)-binding protein n=1 Tax=Marinomonas sp. PE14-40 TaxID=3060621 RepID=UPI003F67B2E0